MVVFFESVFRILTEQQQMAGLLGRCETTQQGTNSFSQACFGPICARTRHHLCRSLGPRAISGLMMFVHPRGCGTARASARGRSPRSGLPCAAWSAEVVADCSRPIRCRPPSPQRSRLVQNLPDLVRKEDRESVQTDLEREVGQEFEHFISGCLPSAVAVMLRDEHPQARATALLLMGADNASKVLSLMLDREQYECTRRMARIKSIDGKTAKDVEQSLREALGSGMIDRFRFQGVDQTARSLCRMGKEAYEPLLKTIASRDASLADAIRKRMVRFEDLQALTGEASKLCSRKSTPRSCRGTCEPTKPC